MASSKVYEVRLHVTEHNLGTVLGALAGSSTLVSVTPTQSSAQPENGTAHQRQTHYAEGIRNKGISGKDLAMEILSSSSQVFDMREIKNGFVARKFAGNSAGPVLSGLVREGKVRALGNGKFCLSGTSIRILGTKMWVSVSQLPKRSVIDSG